jgi:hypothetical protein
MIEKRSERRKPDGRDPGEPDIRDRYESPVITSCSSEEILEQVGPAHACSPAPCGIF